MKRKYIKMNDGNILSFGNLFKVIKEEAKNSKLAMQSEIFSAIFNINDVNSSTVNNYCIGIRAIGLEYKSMFNDMYKRYLNNYEEFVSQFIYILNILDEKIYVCDKDSLLLINSNERLKKVIDKMIKISYIDDNVNNDFSSKLEDLYNRDNLYECFINILYYVILENKQPVFTQSLNIKFDMGELEEFLKVKLYFGESYISNLLYLHKKGNMHASSELASYEFEGLISGKPNYDACFEYYLAAASRGCPKGCFMVAHLILSKRVKYDFDTMWKYLNKAVDLDSAAGYNTLGKCYLNGICPGNRKNKEKAIKYFKIASSYGYTFAYNNLGYICEKEGNMEDALEYYKISADMGNSWALNKVGEYYRKKGDLLVAFNYYNKAIEVPYKEASKWAYYNLAKYYYEKGAPEIGIKCDKKLADAYMKKIEKGTE